MGTVGLFFDRWILFLFFFIIIIIIIIFWQQVFKNFNNVSNNLSKITPTWIVHIRTIYLINHVYIDEESKSIRIDHR
jgi:hypothetical protein